MEWNRFSDLPDEARVWIHGFDRDLMRDQQELIRRGLKDFLPQWVSHGEPVQGAFDIVADRFVVTAAYCRGGMSGCSIDSLVRNFKQLRDLHGLNGLQGGLLFFRDEEGRVKSGAQSQFKTAIQSGAITGATAVFQTSIGTLGQLRQGEFVTPLRNSWLARVLPIPA